MSNLEQAARQALEALETVLADAYHRRFPECCGRPGSECCGNPNEAWTPEDNKIMDVLSPAQRQLSDALRAALEQHPTDMEAIRTTFYLKGLAAGTNAECRKCPNSQAQPPAIPPGYKLVPVEPNIGMTQAALYVSRSYAEHDAPLRRCHELNDAALVYRAMLEAVPEPAAMQPVSKDLIRTTFLAHGFTVKEGQADLKPYVYEAAYSLLNATTPAAVAQEPAIYPEEAFDMGLEAIPYYTAQQSRKPLTPEHVRAAGGIIHSDGNVFFTSLDRLNRAIEAAHGITGETA